MKISIRWALIAGFLGLIWGTYAVTTTSTYLSSEKVLNRHARDIMQNIADLAMEQSQNHLAHAHAAAALTRRLLAADVVGIGGERYDRLERYFLDQLAIYPHFAGLYLGKPNGDFYYVSRNSRHSGAAFRTKIILNGDGGRETRLRWRTETLETVAETLDPQDDYDPRLRPWYKRAALERQIAWTDPYIFFTSHKPGITIAGPTYDSTGALKGIVGVDIEIDQLSNFISHLNIGKNGRAFLINNNGDVVAFAQLAKISKSATVGADQTVQLVKIGELDDVLSRKAFSSMNLKPDAEGRYHLAAPRFARFEHEGRYHHAMLSPFSISEWPWIIGVHLPEDDYLGPLKENRRFNRLLTLAISAVATLIALLFARSITQPVANLEAAALAIKNDDLAAPLDLHSGYKEIRETADAFGRMKAAIVKGREKYREIFENIQDIYYETTLDGILLEISPSIEKTAGFKRKDLIGINVGRFYDNPENRQTFIDMLRKEKRVADYEIVLTNESGQKAYYSLNSVLKTDARGAPLKIIGSMRDITARKKAEQELEKYRTHLEELVKARTTELEKANADLRREMAQRVKTEIALDREEEKYRIILESIEEGYFETDLRGRFTFLNEAAGRMLGLPAAELRGMGFRRFTSLETSRRLLRVFAGVYRSEQRNEIIAFEIVGADQIRRHIELSASLIHATDGAPCGFRGIGRDVTARIKAEEERRRLSEQLQQSRRLESLGTLAGGIAHDFNNLLMGIQGNISLILTTLDSNDPRHEHARSIERCVQSGANLTRQLLGYARGGKYVVKPTNLNALVHKTADLFGRTRREIDIVTDYQEDLWGVNVDQSQIEQVLVNLYLNAWQAMEGGGTLFLKTENNTIDETFVRPYKVKTGCYVKISVRDTGCGMTPEVQAHVFEPFFTTKPMGGGTGLGLASAFGIVKNHGGIIEFVSRPNKGTTFMIYLPATETRVASEVDTSGSLAWGTETILIVDDEQYILEACGGMLRDLGYTVLTARSGEAAVALLKEHGGNIALVILDMIMPGMDGRQTYRRLVQVNPDIKVLLSSGYSLSDISREMLDMGCSAFIQKPFDTYQVSAKIRSLLDGRPHAETGDAE